MFKVGIRQRLYRLGHISSFIPSSTRSSYLKRGIHTPPGHQPRQTCGSILLALSLFGGLSFCLIHPNLLVPFVVIHADSSTPVSSSSEDELQDEDKQDEDKKEEEVQEPPEDFTAYGPPVYNRSFWEFLTNRTLEEHLRAYSQIFKVDLPCGIPRYDVSVVTSVPNFNCFSSSNFIQLPSHYWVFFGIYDGHNGNVVASQLSYNLRHTVVGTLVDLYSKHTTLNNAHVELGGGPENQDYWSGRVFGRPYPPAEEIDAAIKQGFMKVDKDIVDGAIERALEAAKRFHNNEPIPENHLPYADAAGLISRAYCGSSAILGVYESDTRQLRMANTGDSRAVLGRRVLDDKGAEVYEVHVLTRDMAVPSGFVDDPPRKVQAPAELVYSFGDGPWKWSEEIRQQLSDAFPFVTSSEHPYAKATAEPEITTTEIKPGDFLVVGNRGFWSSLTNEEAVGLVGLWLKKYGKTVYGDWVVENGDDMAVYDPETASVVQPSSTPHVPSTTAISIWRKDVFERQDLPVLLVGKRDDTFMYQLWGIPKKFVIVDRNVAQHLIRNALGGANPDTTAALLEMNSPRARQYRDDVSVEVVFFS